MNTARANTVTVASLAALLIPVVEKLLGITLTTDQAIDLVALITASFHGITSLIERYFPPPIPNALPVNPASQPKVTP